jgi:hypothetical protein
MDAETVRQFYAARPFKAFGLELPDGSVLEVHNPWNLAFVPDGETLDVRLPDGDWRWVKLADVRRIVPLPIGEGSGRKAS